MLADAEHQLRNVAVSDDRLGASGGAADTPSRRALHRRVRRQGAGRGRGPEQSAPVAAVQRGRRGRRGVRAVLASPLPYNQDAVGVVTVLSEQAHPWSAEGELALLAFTDLAALLIASMMQGQQQSELAAQLQTALDSRAVIEQAKGVLIGQQGMSARGPPTSCCGRRPDRSAANWLRSLRMSSGMQQGRDEDLHSAPVAAYWNGRHETAETPVVRTSALVIDPLRYCVGVAPPGGGRPTNQSTCLLPDNAPQGDLMIVVGIVLLLLGFLLKVAIYGPSGSSSWWWASSCFCSARSATPWARGAITGSGALGRDERRGPGG